MIGLGVRTNKLRAESGGGGNVAPSNVTAPVISGSTSLGSVLTTTNGTWSGVPATFSYTYQWKRNGSPIVGATASTYTTVVADSTANITCDVTADNGVAPTATAGSNTLTMANYTPANTVAPVVSGTAVVGQILSTTNGTWTNSPSTFSYQWYRGATLISGATNSTYTLVQADAGNTSNIKCVVTASNGLSASADSNTVDRILDTLTNTYITGLTLTSAEIDSFNTLYLAIRSNSYHTIIDNLTIFATATNAAALKPLFGSNVITPVNSPTWSRKVGYTHTGTSYINMGTSSNVNFTRNNHCLMFGAANKNTTVNGTVGGLVTGSGAAYIVLSNAASVNANSLATQDSGIVSRTITNRDYAMIRQVSTQYFVFQDGVSSSPLIKTTAAGPPTVIYVGAFNNNGTASNIYESGAISEYSLQGSGAIDPSIMRTIIRNFINSL